MPGSHSHHKGKKNQLLTDSWKCCKDGGSPALWRRAERAYVCTNLALSWGTMAEKLKVPCLSWTGLQLQVWVGRSAL